MGVEERSEEGQKCALVRGLRYSTGKARVNFFFADESGNWQVGMCGSDARYLYCSTDSKTTISQFVICSSSYFEWNGRRLFAANLPVKHSEWSRHASERSILQPSAPAVRHEPVPKAGERASRPAASGDI